MSSKLCPICLQNELLSLNNPIKNCPRCGKYELYKDTQVPSIVERERAALSHLIRQNQRGEDEHPLLYRGDENVPDDDTRAHCINVFDLDRVGHYKMPKIVEQANSLIMWLGDHTTGLGDRLGSHLSREEVRMDTQAIVAYTGVLHLEGLMMLCSELWRRGDIDSRKLSDNSSIYKHEVQTITTINFHDMRLTLQGWEKYEELHRGRKGNRAFMSMDYTVNGNDDFFGTLALKMQPRLSLLRLSGKQEIGMIDTQLLERIHEGRVLIVDISNEQNAAFWEAGFAEGVGKPVIYTCEKEVYNNEVAHFDVSHRNLVLWEKDNMEPALEKVADMVKYIVPDLYEG